MSTFTEFAFAKLLEKIKGHCEMYFNNPLAIRYHKPFEPIDEGLNPPGLFSQIPYYELTEVKKQRLLGLIPFQKHRRILSIAETFSNGKLVSCRVYDRKILEVVREDIKNFIKSINALDPEIFTLKCDIQKKIFN